MAYYASWRIQGTLAEGRRRWDEIPDAERRTWEQFYGAEALGRPGAMERLDAASCVYSTQHEDGKWHRCPYTADPGFDACGAHRLSARPAPMPVQPPPELLPPAPYRRPDIARWSDIPESLRRTGLNPQGHTPDWLGCGATTQFVGHPEYWRCAVQALKSVGFCRKHAERLGLVEKLAPPRDDDGLSPRTRNLIRRAFIRWDAPFSLRDFRAFSDDDIRSWRNVGATGAAEIAHIRDTWTDEMLERHLGIKPHDDEADLLWCNWVGEGVAA